MRFFVILLTWFSALQLFSAAPAETNSILQEQAQLARKLTNGVVLVPGPDDANITRVVALILQRSHYLKQPFNDEVSSKFLDRYLDMLDNLHLFFIQSDLQEFEQYRRILDDLTLKDGDITPARVIFTRFAQRLRQNYDYATNLLQTEKFEFNTDERFNLNRKNLPRPKDLAEAKRLWRERLRYEYLQEKLGIGRPEEITRLIQEKLEQRKPKEVLKAIQPKLGKEKAQDIAKTVEQQVGKASTRAIVAGVRQKLQQDNAAEVVKILTRRYTRLIRAVYDYENDDVLQMYLTALAHVYDPHSDYMGHDELENFSIGMKLSLFGIGALLRSEDGYCKIQSLTPNGPAERSKKLKPNDKIIAVAQSNQPPVDVVETKLSKVVEMIRGPRNTEVRLTVIPADAPDPSVRKVISLVRDEIKLEDQAAKARIYEVPYDHDKRVRLGVIDLPSFYSTFELDGRAKGESGEQKSTTLDVARLIKKLAEEKVAGIVLDLRRNGGGSLEEAIRLTGLFIKEGPVVQVKGPEGRPLVEMDPDPSIFYDGPLVVLTSRFSASASEILAGALQDYGRALIVGDSSTHGKGTVQSLLQLRPFMRGHMSLVTSNDPGALKVTIRKFYRASGSSTQLKGVVPDIVLPSMYNHAEVGESSLENPLPWDTIEAAPYEPMNLVAPFLPEIKRRAESRIGTDRDFVYLKDEVSRFEKTLAEKSVSLNEGQRLKEKEEADARIKARKKELAGRPEPPGKIYEITLKQVDEPGLPPPLAKTNAVKIAVGPAAPPGKVRVTSRDGEMAASADPVDLPDEDNGELAEDKTTAVDIVLDESRRILLDLLELTANSHALAGTPPKTPPLTTTPH